MLHIALIAAGAYFCTAGLAYLVVFPILRAGREADRSRAEEKPLPELEIEVAAVQDEPARTPARFRRQSRFARRGRRPLATRRPGS